MKSTPDTPPVDKRPVLTTNRKKAIFFQQIFCLTFATYAALLKYTMNEKRVNPLDICMMRTLVLFLFSIVLGYATSCDFNVPSNHRMLLFVRCILGTIGYTSITFAISMVPLVV